jgi:hypothetical protein
VQRTLRTIEDWCKEHKLEISKEKSALLPMFIRNREIYKSNPTITTWGLKVVSKLKYLGIMLDCNLDWYPNTQHQERKLQHIRNNLIRCSKATWGMSYYNLVTIYKHAILPVITYATEAWHGSISRRAKDKLQQIQRAFLIFLTKAYRRVSLFCSLMTLFNVPIYIGYETNI